MTTATKQGKLYAIHLRDSALVAITKYKKLKALIRNLDLIQRINQQYAALSPQSQKVARYLQQNPIVVLSESTTQIATHTHTSKATVSRLFKQLGYESQQQAKAEFSRARQNGYPLGSELASNEFLRAEQHRIQKTLEGISVNQQKQLIAALTKASKVTIIGFRNSYPVAQHFTQQLLQLRGNVRLLPHPGQSLGESLVLDNTDEAYVVMGFRRRPSGFSALIDRLPTNSTWLITDPTGQHFEGKVAGMMICYLGEESALDSYGSVFSLVALVANAMYAELGVLAQQRIATISDNFQSLNELDS